MNKSIVVWLLAVEFGGVIQQPGAISFSSPELAVQWFERVGYDEWRIEELPELDWIIGNEGDLHSAEAAVTRTNGSKRWLYVSVLKTVLDEPYLKMMAKESG